MKEKKTTIRINVQEEKVINISDLVTNVEDTLWDIILGYIQQDYQPELKIEIEENDEFTLYKKVIIEMYNNLIKFYGNNIVNENNIENKDDE